MWKRQFLKIPFFHIPLENLSSFRWKKLPTQLEKCTIHLVDCLLQIVEVSGNLQI